METKVHTSKFLKQRKFLLVLPLLVIPFLIVLFVALGGGKGRSLPMQDPSNRTGLNLKLPDAYFKKGNEKDKLGLYEQSAKDSAIHREAMKNDPFYKSSLDTDEENKNGELQNILQHSAAQYNQQGLAPTKKLNSFVTNSGGDSNEAKLMQKLAQLKNELNRKTEGVQQIYSPYTPNSPNPDLDKLQSLMSNLKQNNRTGNDPELDHIDGMLDKIMNIQHPEKLEDSMKRLTLKNKPESYSVTLTDETDTLDQSRFYGLVDDGTETNQPNSIEAVVEETQTLVSGAVVKMRLLQNIYIHGSLIAKDQLIYGTASISNERLKIAINSIRSNQNILPVSLEVYDMDGLQGIYIPGSINRDVSKESADEAIGSLGLTNLDPSLGAQAANAGIQAAKTLMAKKIKLVRVNVKAGYRVLLKDLNKK